MDMNTLLATGHIALWLLFVGLFLPRCALFIACFVTGNYPANTLPILLNILSWLLFPRFLMAYFIFIDIGTNNLWFWAYLITGIVGFFGESGFLHRRVIRRTEVTRDGKTTTTVEEEEVL